MPNKIRLYMNQLHHVDSLLCITFNRTSHNTNKETTPKEEKKLATA